QRLLMDIGLVELDNLEQWSTAVPGIAPIAPVLDLYDNSFSLQLLTMKVVGQSAISGMIRGEIHGLFYRYKAMGGSEYLADFLIGPETSGPNVEGVKEKSKTENVSLGVHHGDSGTLLFIEHTDRHTDEAGQKVEKTQYHPFAVLWG